MSKLNYTGFTQVKKQKLIGVRPLLRSAYQLEHAMNTDPMGVLKTRLAAGEISIEEYPLSEYGDTRSSGNARHDSLGRIAYCASHHSCQGN